MRRLITYFNSLFLGVILGMIFVAIFHAPSSHRQEVDHDTRIAKVCALFGTKSPTTAPWVAATAMQLAHLPAELRAYLAGQGCHAS